MNKKLIIENSWKSLLSTEFQSNYFIQMIEFLSKEYAKKIIYPDRNDIFRSFNSTPVDSVKAVILGQDPYHGHGQAHGLSFSIKKGVRIPPSLRNILKELHRDLGINNTNHGNLQKWADQGVLLLNSVLTVEKSMANSHKYIGWEKFTDATIKALNDHKENVVFILWGKQAQRKKLFIDRSKHLILESAHPSPLSAYNGFVGCSHFSRTNSYLKKNKIREIDWSLI